MRTGLLGASAAMAMGAVAVASGLVPGPGGLGGPQRDDRVQAEGPADLDTAVPLPAPPAGSGTEDGAADRADSGKAPGRKTSRDGQKDGADQSGKQRPPTSAEPSRKQSSREKAGTGDGASPKRPGGRKDAADARGPDARQGVGDGGSTAAPPDPDTPDTESAAEREVLALVNQERAKAGCRPVEPDAELAELAGDFSADMARRGFFSHTSPDGQSPWDRADRAGISDLGGENIARGQANAQSVMDSWMKSPGHRANILNCDYRTMGVGARFAEGGPWWTQEFGF
ncbi:CAP domain-containing protein [Streptomyces boncukensis]|uniref:CAP domain-containing protein n=1 Tax=Streptomyces boncukensis TaxID=2711219 RepID=A0A6G4WPB9_9ACTN|nr:CAP domain-containing protein [Streptomyces boncukensis]